MLVVARTVTSAVRLLDELELLAGDFRIQVWFALDPGSRFSDGGRELLARAGARVLEPDQLAAMPIDLVLTASENTDLTGIAAPALMLPHGVGFHKNLRDVDGLARLSGVTVSDLTERDDVQVILTHPDQRTQLQAAGSNLAARTVTVRDTYLDRLTASLPWRAAYRRALGVEDDRRLILITSTWGEHALLNLWQRLPARLLACLPADEYAVAVVLHPNIWSGHSAWQVNTWLADAADAGLVIVPPESGWPAAVVAADLVIGDHGSVTFYAAALPRPVLLASAGGPEVVTGSALAQLVTSAARWNPGADPRTQIDAAIDGFSGADAAKVRDAAFDPQTSGTVRSLVYDVLKLTAPDRGPRAWPVPQREPRPANAFQVRTTSLPDGSIAAQRFPAAVIDENTWHELGSEPPGTVSHLAIWDDDLDVGRHQSASVLLARGLLSGASARRRLTAHRRHHVLTAARLTSGAVLIARSTGPLLRVTAVTPALAGDARDIRTTADRTTDDEDDDLPDVMLVTAAVYHLLVRRAETQDRPACRDDGQEQLHDWPAEVAVRIGDAQTIHLRIASEPTSTTPADQD